MADLPIRCVNITSWPAAEISAGGAFCCSLSDDTVSAISSRSDDWRLMVRRALPTCVRIFCWLITVPAFFSARSISGTIFSTSACELGQHRLQAQRFVAGLQAAHGLGQHVRAFLHVGEGLRAAHQGLRHRLGESLRLHQRLAGTGHLLGDRIGLAHREDGHRAQDHQRQGQQGEQDPLVRDDGCGARAAAPRSARLRRALPVASIRSSATLSGSAGPIEMALSLLAGSIELAVDAIQH